MVAILSRPRCVNIVSALMSVGSALKELIEGDRLTNEIDKGSRFLDIQPHLYMRVTKHVVLMPK